MSSGPQPLDRPPQDQRVLGELLHSLSQPLTSLRCSLELSIEEAAGEQQAAVAAALQQADQVIGLVKLMREYLDAESAVSPARPVLLAPVLRAIVEQLTSIAAGRQVRLQLAGTCAATVPVAEPRLRLALQYLINVLIELQPANREITLRLEPGPSGSMLRAQVANASCPAPGGSRARHDPVNTTLCRVKLAIASRVLESAGASLVFESAKSGFVIAIPKQPAPPLSPEILS